MARLTAPARSASSPDDPLTEGRGRVVLLLGPTNTGKTHRAIERMLELPSGMIGLPLRLLAREVYDKVSARVGEARVALITGEEKRVPARPAYWIATVEAMPRDRPVDFLAIDEVQLAAQAERGHVFTDRILSMRGAVETWLLGAETMRPVLEQLLPGAESVSCPRLSRLSHEPPSSLGALRRRSALIAFSVPRVLSLAERVRARKGGAAVVIGALSPRTRNAQVAMYQAGEVDFLVATDAIGMGLNLAIDHVAFSELSKFDGSELRPLDAAEIGQIAGRAGRHVQDGTFGCVTGADVAPALPRALATRVEQHRFEPATRLYYRSSALDFASLEALAESLRAPAPDGRFVRAPRGADQAALGALVQREEIASRARDEARVRLLWEVATVPDYRQLLFEDHVETLGRMFVALCDGGRIDPAWIDAELARLRRPEDDLFTLMDRIADVRIWNYVANQPGWVEDPAGVQAAARDAEDALSEALHRALVSRFVEPKIAGRPPKPPSSRGETPKARPSSPFEQLAALRDRMVGPDPAAGTAGASRWLEDLLDAPHGAFTVDELGRVSFGERRIGRLTRGRSVDGPFVAISLEVQGGARLRLERRLSAFARDIVPELLAPLPLDGGALSPAGRGVLHQLGRGLGTVATRDVAAALASLEADDRTILARAGVSFGRFCVYLPRLLKPEAQRLRAGLATVFVAAQGASSPFPTRGELSVPVRGGISHELYTAVGYPVIGDRAIRCDILERVLGRLAERGAEQIPTGRLASWLGCKPRDAAALEPALDAVASPGTPVEASSDEC